MIIENMVEAELFMEMAVAVLENLSVISPTAKEIFNTSIKISMWEYFKKAKKKEGEHITLVRELYSMGFGVTMKKLKGN
jgi:hypothetical protein